MFNNKNNITIIIAAILAVCLYTNMNNKKQESYKPSGCGCGM